jgi:hypothetical protein
MNKQLMSALVAGMMLLGAGQVLAADKTIQQQCEESAKEASEGNTAEIQSYVEACLAEYAGKALEGGETAPQTGSGQEQDNN